MATLTIPDATYMGLAAQAALRNITIEELVLLRLVAPVIPVTEPTPTIPLTGEARKAIFEAMKSAADKRADRYPPCHVLDDSRETIYADRLDAQL